MYGAMSLEALEMRAAEPVLVTGPLLFRARARSKSTYNTGVQHCRSV